MRSTLALLTALLLAGISCAGGGYTPSAHGDHYFFHHDFTGAYDDCPEDLENPDYHLDNHPSSRPLGTPRKFLGRR